MFKSWKAKLSLVLLSLVCFLGSSGLVAAQTCPSISTLSDNWNYTQAWCGEISINGPATVNPGTDWVGTIEPANSYATCSVSSNSGCSLGCYVSADRSEVVVPVGPNHCGSFTVTITQPARGGCPEPPASPATKAVRINNAGQGGSWTVIDYFQGGCPTWPPGPCINNCTGYNMPCPGTPAIYDGKYKIGSGGSCTYAATYQYRGCPGTGCDSGQSGTPDPGGFCPTGELESTICYASPRWDTVCSCVKYGWELCEWKCNTCE